MSLESSDDLMIGIDRFWKDDERRRNQVAVAFPRVDPIDLQPEGTPVNIIGITSSDALRQIVFPNLEI